MKLKFKHQPFQAEAAAAVCDVFNDQPLRTANYRIDLGDTTNMQQRMDFSEVGFRNHPLVPELTRSRILENLRAVQIRNNLKPSDALAGPGINLTIEMETGTGKTYTYVKTMYELNRRYGWSKFIIVVPSVASGKAWPNRWKRPSSIFLMSTARRFAFLPTPRTS